MTNQKREERKKKKREKIRKEHLAKAEAHRLEQATKDAFGRKHIVKDNMPHKDDMKGWTQYNALQMDKIYQEASRMYPDHTCLKRFCKDPGRMNKFDLHEVEDLMTKAAQKLYCIPPYVIPYVSIRRSAVGIETGVPRFILDKVFTSRGSGWYYKQIPKVKFGETEYGFVMSTHAVDRFYKRYKPMFKDELLRFVSLWLRLSFLSVYQWTKDGDEYQVVPISADHKDSQAIIGYCPVEVTDKYLLGKSFLLPTMAGTPERLQMVKAGIGEVRISDVVELAQQQDYLRKNGIIPGYMPGRTEEKIDGVGTASPVCQECYGQDHPVASGH